MPTEIYAYLNPADVARWYRALANVERQVRKELDDNPKRCSVEYVTLVIQNIITQRFAGGYAPYTEAYEEWKSKFGKKSGFWQLFGDLVRRLTHFRVTDRRKGVKAWMGGIPANIIDAGGKSMWGEGDYGPPKPIAMYGFVMEWGGEYGRGGTHPGRPVFMPTAKQYARRHWGKQGGTSLRNIGSRWK